MKTFSLRGDCTKPRRFFYLWRSYSAEIFFWWTSDQFRFIWRSGPNHTPRMRMGSLLQRKSPGRVSLPLQVPSRKPLLLLKLTLAPATRSYSATAFFTALISRRPGTKTMISSANAETLAVRGPAKGIPRRAGFPPSPSLSLRSRGSKARS